MVIKKVLFNFFFFFPSTYNVCKWYKGGNDMSFYRCCSFTVSRHIVFFYDEFSSKPKKGKTNYMSKLFPSRMNISYIDIENLDMEEN